MIINSRSGEFFDEVCDDSTLVGSEVRCVILDGVALDDDVAGLADDLHPFEDGALGVEGDERERQGLLSELYGGGVALIADEGDA